MKKSLVFSENSFVQLMEHLDYPELGLSNQVVWHGAQCQYNLLCLAAQATFGSPASVGKQPRACCSKLCQGTKGYMGTDEASPGRPLTRLRSSL